MKITMKRLTAADLETLRSYAEGRLVNAIDNMRGGWGNPAADVVEALRILEACQQMVPVDHPEMAAQQALAAKTLKTKGPDRVAGFVVSE